MSLSIFTFKLHKVISTAVHILPVQFGLHHMHYKPYHRLHQLANMIFYYLLLVQSELVSFCCHMVSFTTSWFVLNLWIQINMKCQCHNTYIFCFPLQKTKNNITRVDSKDLQMSNILIWRYHCLTEVVFLKIWNQ